MVWKESPKKDRGAGATPKPAVDCSQRHPSALPPAGRFEGELQLVLTVTLEQV
jgi:hypothetical protein